LEDIFRQHFGAIRKAVTTAEEGSFVAVAVLSNTLLTGVLHIPAPMLGLPGTAVVGRHERADLRLTHDPSVALRHIIAVVNRSAGGKPVMRLLDLKTGQGFSVEGA